MLKPEDLRHMTVDQLDDEALTLGAAKLPIKTRFIARRGDA